MHCSIMARQVQHSTNSEIRETAHRGIRRPHRCRGEDDARCAPNPTVYPVAAKGSYFSEDQCVGLAASRLRIVLAAGLLSAVLTIGITCLFYVLTPAQASVQSSADSASAGAIVLPFPERRADEKADAVSQPSLILGERKLAFASRPRQTGRGFMAAPAARAAWHAGAKASPAKARGADSSMRLEWQGDWELNNPRANAARAEGYLKRANREFGRNMSRSLRVRRSGAMSLLQGVGRADAAALPIMRYSR